MKKVLALSLFFAIISFSASAQVGMHQGIRKHRTEQRLQNRNEHFNQRGNPNIRREMLHRKVMRHRAMENRGFKRGDGRKMRMMQMQHRRKMMMRRHHMRGRVI